jgi:hypothetical protein
MTMKTQKMIFSLVIGSVAVGMISSCQKKETVADRSVDASGNCTYSYITHYNKVVSDTLKIEEVYATEPLDEKAATEAINELRDSCLVMINEHKNMNCSAKTVDENSVVPVRYDSLKPNCTGVFAKVKANQGKPTTEKPLSGDEAKVKYRSIMDVEYVTEDDSAE